MATTNDLRQIKRKKKRKSLLKRIIIALTLAFVFLIGYITKDKWLPIFDGIVYKIQNIISKEDFTKNFPIKTGSSSEYKLVSFKDKLVLLTDTKYTIYDRDGEVSRTIQHAMTSPIIKTYDERLLVYDLGGTKLNVERRSESVYSKTFSDKILYATLGDNGYVAVVTNSDINSCDMTIFDSKGKKIFFTSFNQKILDITFTKGSKGCVVTTMMAQGGQFKSKQYCFNFNKDKEEWIGTPIVNLVLTSAINKDENIILVGDHQYNVMSGSGEVKYTYSYTSELIDKAIGDDITVLILQNTQLRDTEMVIIDKYNKQNSVKLNNEFKKVLIKDNQIYILSKKSLEVYSLSGQLVTTKEFQDYYTDIAVIDDYIYLLGSQKIDIINIKTS